MFDPSLEVSANTLFLEDFGYYYNEDYYEYYSEIGNFNLN